MNSFLMPNNTRDELARSEQDINKARVEREQAQREDDRRTRARLESRAGYTPRLPFPDVLNKVAADNMGRLQGLAALNAVRDPLPRKTAGATLAKSESFDRLQRSRYDIKPSDPGQTKPSRFGPGDRVGPDLSAVRRKLEAAGKMIEAGRALSTGGEENAVRAEWLLATAQAIIAEAREQGGVTT